MPRSSGAVTSCRTWSRRWSASRSTTCRGRPPSWRSWRTSPGSFAGCRSSGGRPPRRSAMNPTRRWRATSAIPARATAPCTRAAARSRSPGAPTTRATASCSAWTWSASPSWRRSPSMASRSPAPTGTRTASTHWPTPATSRPSPAASTAATTAWPIARPTTGARSRCWLRPIRRPPRVRRSASAPRHRCSRAAPRAFPPASRAARASSRSSTRGPTRWTSAT